MKTSDVGYADIADIGALVQSACMSRFAQILDVLSKAGWSVAPLELASDCWWAKEIWELRSEWTPKGAVIYLSLLVDPMDEFDRNNTPDAAVWAVGISNDLPKDRLDAEQLVIPIKRRMKDAIAEIVSETAELRMAR
jgi:hypothetical protein